MFRIGDAVSKPRQPQVRLVVQTRPMTYTNFHPETEERILSHGFETVQETVGFAADWEEKPPVRYEAASQLMFGVGEQFAEKGVELLTSGKVIPTNLLTWGCAGKLQDRKRFFHMNYFAKMVEMSRDYLKAEAAHTNAEKRKAAKAS